MSRSIYIEHGDTTYAGQIGVITSTNLGYESHGILTAYLTVQWKNGGVNAGGFCLDQPVDREAGNYDREGTAYGLDHIMQILKTVGVEKWEALKGKEVIVLFEGESYLGSRSVGIASTTDESKVLVFKEHADYWNERVGNE